MLQSLVETLVTPPALVLWVFLGGTLLVRGRPRLGRALQVGALALLWILSAPACGGALLRALQRDPALPPTGALPAAGAIVVLSADVDRAAAEYGGADLGPTTLSRLRYAAALQRRTGLPLLTSGGAVGTGLPAIAELMARTVRDELGARVRWTEARSADTWENAAFSAELLRAADVRTVLLVTSAWHMPRAAWCFRAHGIDVVPAPTGFRGPAIEDWRSFLPHWKGLRDTCLALHEGLGAVWYLATRSPAR